MKAIVLQNKPMFLKNIVKPFEVYFAEVREKIREASNDKNREAYVEIAVKMNNRLTSYSLFLLQPFQPEMIMGYFKGFNKPIGINYLLAKYDSVFIITYAPADEAYKIHITDGVEDCLISVNPRPTTLQQFISDCTRAGIELQWKED